MLGNGLVHEQDHIQEFADQLQDRQYEANIRWPTWAEALSAQQQLLWRNMHPWASSFPIEQGFSHLLFPPLVSKWPTKLDTELSPYWQSMLYQLSLDGHHNDFTSTELWQPMPSFSPQNLIPAQSQLNPAYFSLCFLSILTACVTFSSYRDGNIMVLHL